MTIRFKSEWLVMILLFWGSFLTYMFSHGLQMENANYFNLLADAFLHGKVYLDQGYGLNELVKFQGQYFVVYPPGPAIVMMPLIKVLGIEFYQPILSWMAGGLNVLLCYLVMKQLSLKRKLAVTAALIYGLGSFNWFQTSVGSVWYIAHVLAQNFVWLMILESMTKKRFWLIGCLVGMAYLMRLPAILVVVFPVIYLWKDLIFWGKDKHKNWNNAAWLVLMAGIFVIINGVYNYVRYGVVYDIGYSLLPVFDEPWYQNGLFSIKNIPIHLAEVFFTWPRFIPNWPFFVPSLNITSIWFAFPSIVLVLWADFKKLITIAAVFAVIVCSLPGLAHGSNGFSQFGFRFGLDYFPLIMLIIGSGITKVKYIWVLVLFGLGFWINASAVVLIRYFNIWTW